MKTNKQIREQRKAEGKCINCSKPKGKTVYCDQCRANNQRSRAKFRKKLREDHKCTCCYRPMPKDWFKTKCVACLDKQRGRFEQQVQERATAGLCTSCGVAPAAKSKRLCDSCLEKEKERQRERTAKFNADGICKDCGREPARPLRLTCRTCHLESKFRAVHSRVTRKAAGLCVRCGIDRHLEGFSTCATCRAIKRGKNKELHLRVFEKYGGAKCNCCGESTYEFLEIDHVNNDGKTHRRKARGAASIHTWLRANNYPPGFQVLCRNCNMAKHKFGVCPHKRRCET